MMNGNGGASSGVLYVGTSSLEPVGHCHGGEVPMTSDTERLGLDEGNVPGEMPTTG